MKFVAVGFGLEALVDDADYGLVMQYRWCVLRGPTGLLYARHQWQEGKKRRAQLMHNLIMGVTKVDHRDHNGLNNQRINLRLASDPQNQGNRRPSVGGASRFKGVSQDKGRWRAKIGFDGSRISLGSFESEEEAALAYDCAASSLFGEFACTNEMSGLL